jgi:hypothetical protein
MASTIAYGSGGYGTGGFGGYYDITGSVVSIDTGGTMSWDSEDKAGMVTSVDSQQYCRIWQNRIRHGTVTTIDTDNQSISNGIEISQTTVLSSGPSFIQGKILDPLTGLNLTFWDSTYIGGTLTDGTYVGGEYVTRLYNPIWLNYSIWYLTPPVAQPSLQGYLTRTAQNPSVGQYYANMYAPDVPGSYEIRWRYQKDQSSHALEIDAPFEVTSWGISSQPDYS